MIPRKLHQIWFQGQAKLPAKYKPNQKKWKQLHPDYEYCLWSEANIIPLLKRDFSWLYPVWSKLPYMIQKIDLAKLCILYKYGGVYCDMDMTPRRSISPSLEGYEMVLSQCDMDVFREWVSQFLGIPAFSQHHINNAFIAAVPRHLCIGWALYLASHNALLVDKNDDLMLHEIYTTLTCGPEVLNEAYDRWMKTPTANPQKTKVYPPEVFEPKLNETTNQPEVTDQTVVTHQSERTWVKQVKPIGAEDLAKYAYWGFLLLVVLLLVGLVIWLCRCKR